MSHLESVKTALDDGSALLVTSEVNQRWLTNFAFTDGYVLVTKGESYLITDFRYIEAARAEADPDFTILMPSGRKMIEEISSLLKNAGVGTLLIEDDTLSVSAFERIKASIPDVNTVSGGSAVIDGLRRFKDSSELLKLARAQAITDAAFEHILGYINPERTEIDVALELEFFMRKNGAEGLSFETISVSGSASSMPHGVPRPVKLEKGFLTMDFGAKVDGYCADMTRTVVIGKADDDMKRLYNTVLTAQTSALEALYGGERERKKIDAIARDIINNAGYTGCFGHSLGHGIGMYCHEAPGLSPASPAGELLMPGDVVTCEPGIYLSGKYGCRIEDMVAVTNDGIINFTKSPKELIELCF